jgi:Protein of unknown function (DUF4058)
MPSPFPGIDPYLESQGRWLDFHARFLTYCSDAIAARLPRSYVVQIDERIRLVESSTGEKSLIRPDLMIERREPSSPNPPVPAAGGTAVLEPVVIPFEVFEEVRERRIEIIHLPDRSLVTVLELLSPANKIDSGYYDYLDKRLKLYARPINLVELDFLLGGQRLPMRRPLPPGDYYALVARADRRPDCDVYAWTVRRPLPRIPIPLKGPDPDLTIDLSELFTLSYERGAYDRLVDYRAPLGLPLPAGDLAWIEERAKAAAGQE